MSSERQNRKVVGQVAIYTSEIMNALIGAGLTYSPEAGDPFPMREIPCAKVATVIAQYLVEHDVMVYHDVPDNNGKVGV